MSKKVNKEKNKYALAFKLMLSFWVIAINALIVLVSIANGATLSDIVVGYLIAFGIAGAIAIVAYSFIILFSYMDEQSRIERASRY